jgi:hypothetical protein
VLRRVGWIIGGFRGLASPIARSQRQAYPSDCTQHSRPVARRSSRFRLGAMAVGADAHYRSDSARLWLIDCSIGETAQPAP